MKQRLALAVAAAALFLPALAAVAEPQEVKAEHRMLSPEDRAALTDARLAALKAGLKLTPAQEKNWPALEAAIREGAKARAARMAEWMEKRKQHEGHRDAIEAMQERAKALQAHAARMTALADAAKPLYESLDEGQRRRFGLLMRGFGGHRGHWEHGGQWAHAEQWGHDPKD